MKHAEASEASFSPVLQKHVRPAYVSTVRFEMPATDFCEFTLCSSIWNPKNWTPTPSVRTVENPQSEKTRATTPMHIIRTRYAGVVEVSLRFDEPRQVLTEAVEKVMRSFFEYSIT